MAMIETTGLAEARRMLVRMYPEVRRAWTIAMKGIAREVAGTASEIASEEIPKRSGDLLKGIKPSVRATTAMIRETAEHRGFNYPVRFEYGDYHKPFMVPAIERRRAWVIEQLEGLIQLVVKSANI